MKVIYTGLESAGKSLKLAMKVVEIAERNANWQKISGKTRPIYSNMRFTVAFEEFCDSLGVELRYWEDIDELIQLTNCDVIIDEVGTYFDSRLWQDLSLDARRWLAQGAKSGIEIYGSAQDFAQVDKSFRRLVNYLFEIRKLVGSRRPSATKPPVKRIWGICLGYELNPRSYSEDNKEYLTTFPEWFVIEKKYCDIFDTTQKILASKPQPLKHIERMCEDPTCTYHIRGKVSHV